MEKLEIKTVLVSVSNKEHLLELIGPLFVNHAKIISTGGTADFLMKNAIECKTVEEITGFAEVLDGRVKTLHPKIHAGILADKSKPEHLLQLSKNNIREIDMVVVNLYPFKETVSNKTAKLHDAIENIDIGGVALLRAAAKNHESVAVVSSVEQYAEVIKELKENNFSLSIETRRKLAREAFESTALYDALIAQYLGNKFDSLNKFPKNLTLPFERIDICRYGENPDQAAAVYKSPVDVEHGITMAEKLNGKELSFNNYLDIDSAVAIVNEFVKPTVAIIKHTNPCGVASADDIADAFAKAYDADSLSAFGGVIAMNRKCDLKTAKQITAFFNEIVIAPDYEKQALEELKTKKNLRIMKLPSLEQHIERKEFDVKKISSGLLVQEPNNTDVDEAKLHYVSERRPGKGELMSLIFAWKVSKHVKSNAIVVANGLQTVGIGAGQTSRVASMEIALKNAGERVKGAVIASDGFFPFRDSIDLAAKYGIPAIIQPGGSLKDGEVIQAANENGIALVFTGIRNFKH